MKSSFLKRLSVLAIASLLGACVSGPRIDTSYSAASQGSRVEFIILHHTVGDFPNSLTTLTEKNVSSHYLIRDNPPEIYRLVDESARAFHAGESAWKSYGNLNNSSIGIEIVNHGYQDSEQGRFWFPYPSEQIDQVISLLKQIVARYRIKPENILGHSDIAPQRKLDPGPLFPWKRLADAGLIRWPDAAMVAARQAAYALQLPDVLWFQQKLAQHGFSVGKDDKFDRATKNVVAAFQMKYRPARFDGVLDAETAALLDVLTTAPP